jgi:hypothetical protein
MFEAYTKRVLLGKKKHVANITYGRPAKTLKQILDEVRDERSAQ